MLAGMTLCSSWAGDLVSMTSLQTDPLRTLNKKKDIENIVD
jgi:hypothetical protein